MEARRNLIGIDVHRACIDPIRPIGGLVVDRYGPRRVAIPGVILVCISVSLLSLTTASLWSWWALWCFVAFAGLFIKPLVWTAAVSSLFERSRGLALAVALCGTSLASVVTPILCTWLMRQVGWRGAYIGIAAFFSILVIPAVLFMFTSAVDERRTSKAPQRDDVRTELAGLSVRAAFGSLRFYRLLAAAFLMSVAPAAIGTSMVPILMSFDHPPLLAATIAGLAGGATIVGRLSGGYLLDRVNGNAVAAVGMLLPALGVSLMLAWPSSISALMAASMIVGLSVGAELDAVAYLTTRHFGVRSFGVLFGVIGAALSTASAVGPIFLNTVYDLTGSYRPALFAYLPVCVCGSILFLTLGRYPTFESRVTA